MIANLDLILPAVFGLAAVLYLLLAIRVSRAYKPSAVAAIRGSRVID